jgi:two-component system LytT family response regulator
MTKLIHIDDDPQSITLLKMVCTNEPDIFYLGGFTNPIDGIDFLKNNDVDIVMLDIEMPEMNGFKVANIIKDSGAAIIFLTSHTEFATEAFDACALHYLVKPITKDLFAKGVEKYKNAKAQLSTHQSEQVEEMVTNYFNNDSYPKRIFVNHLSKISILTLEQVMYLFSSVNYTTFVTAKNEKIISSKNIKLYEDALARHPDFIRIHRSYIINKNFADGIKKGKNKFSIIMKDKNELEISLSKKQEILSLLAN